VVPLKDKEVSVGVIIVMGVSGAGKTTVGQILAEKLSWNFSDADDFHSSENKAKMNKSIPLTDDDRKSWLESLSKHIGESLECSRPLVLACSALKRSHRAILAQGNEGIFFVYLRGDMDLIKGRLEERKGHFMSPALLKNQFEALEEPTPDDAVHVDISPEPEKIVDTIISHMKSDLVIELS
jgi:gluconokinase